MITLPEVTVVGTLVADPEVRWTASGVAVANFTVACNDRKKNPQTGEWEDGDATFLRGSIWRDHAENVANTLRKGQRVVVIGRLRERSYEKDGETRRAFELDAEEIAPSLKWATAVVTKAARGGSGNGGNGGNAGKASGWRESGGRAKAAAASDDPWGSVPPPSDGEPPF